MHSADLRDKTNFQGLFFHHHSFEEKDVDMALERKSGSPQLPFIDINALRVRLSYRWFSPIIDE